MRYFSIGLVIFGLLPHIGRTQPKANREHPLPLPYRLEHFGGVGQVESITTYDSKNHLMTAEQFDRQGRLVSSVNFSGLTTTTTYSYDSVKQLITVFYQTGKMPAISVIYQTDRKGNVIFKLHKVDDPLRAYSYRGDQLLKDSSANRFSSDKVYYSYYTYDKAGRLATVRDFKGDGSISREEDFSYQKLVVTIVGKTYSQYAPATSYEKKKFYNTGGQLVKSTFTTNGKAETVEYQLDPTGNWISKSDGLRRTIVYYSVAKAAPAVAQLPSTPVAPNLLVDESFIDNRTKWGEWDNEGAAAKVSEGYYRFRIKQRNNFSSWLYVNSLASQQDQNFAIEARFVLNTTDVGNPNDSYWLLWGIGNNAKDYYAFGIYPEGKFQYGRLNNSNWDAKEGSKASSAVRAGVNQANLLRIEKRRDSVYFFVNNSRVLSARYEAFDARNTGVGFQFNNPKTIDVDFLRVAILPSGSVLPTATALAPPSALPPATNPLDASFTLALSRAKQSTDRANALMEYLTSSQSAGTPPSVLEQQLAEKMKQVLEIDFYALFEWKLQSAGKTVPLERAKLVFGLLLKMLTKEQKEVMDFYMREVAHQPGVQVYNQTTGITETITRKLDWPVNAPKPGYGWNKTVSSNPQQVTPAAIAASTQPIQPQANEPTLADWQAYANDMQGAMIYLTATKTCYYFPSGIKLKSDNDELELAAIGSGYTYSYSSGRNEFRPRVIKGQSKRISIKILMRMIDQVAGAYMVAEIGPCKHCSGGGGSWNNASRTKSYCSHCNATGCAPRSIWNNGSIRGF